MADDLYRRRVCGLCGKEVYEKLLNTDELDGGYTRINKFEDSGFEDTCIIMCLAKRHEWDMTLCPDCQEKVKQIVIKAMEEVESLKGE